ncbi:hypothetical protein [Conyzicola sp.]|uniref:hypothetical protein n=1 Tax=Conyzicola sp. TaxID=1969404 RepID=UPI00398A38D7
MRADYFVNPGDDDAFDDDGPEELEEFDDYLRNEHPAEVQESEIKAAGGKTSKFSLADVKLASHRIDLAGVLPKIAEWRKEDAVYRGGRPRVLDDRAILIACMLLRADESPMHITGMANIFRCRLDDDARTWLGLDHVKDTGVLEQDQIRWLNRTWRSFHNVLDTMDAWPGPRKLLNREERIELLSMRERNDARRKQERIDWFSNAMLEMTFRMQPRDVRRAWGGALSVDQTAISAQSQRGRSKNVAGTRDEEIRYNADGTEKHKLVLEPDADYYLRKLGKVDGGQPEYFWAYTVDIVIQAAAKAGVKAKHPLLAMSVGVSRPNQDIGGNTVKAMKSIQGRGHRIQRLTADLGYAGNLGAENYNVPLKEIGVPIVTDYKITQKGVQGGKAGSLQVEGGHYCPGTPMGLLDASLDFAEGEIDKATWTEKMIERKKYSLRAKERPDKHGHRPMMCPAVGPGATVECALRDVHNPPSATSKPKPAIMKSRIPKAPDKICTQSSVSFGPHDGVEHEQLLDYGTPEWQETYKHDRNTIESFNDFLKSGPETLDKPQDRKVRGRAAQQFIVTFLLTSANIRKIAKFLADERRIVPAVKRKRRRDTLGLSDYVRPDRLKKTAAGQKRAKARAAAREPEPPMRT